MPACIALHYRTAAPLRVAWERGRVTAVEPGAAGDAARADLPRLAPGLLDIQVNGYGGLDFARPEHVAAIAAMLAARGVSRFCPTVVTAATEEMEDALRAISAALAGDPALERAVPGIHLEGPYISGEDGPRGAHPRAHVRPAAPEHFRRLQRAAGGRIRVLTLAPECPGALELIPEARAAGAAVALGHTAAGGEAIRRAAELGARLSTHLGNGLAASIDRHRNPLWPQLASPALAASFIADGEHLPADAFAAMVAAKGIARSILVSDAVREAGLPPGRYRGVGGGAVDVLASGRVQLAGTPYLAGSGAHLTQCVAWAAACGAVGEPDAIDMASLHPARLLGIGGPPAGLHAGADLLLYGRAADGGLRPLLVTRAGEVVYEGAAAAG